MRPHEHHPIGNRLVGGEVTGSPTLDKRRGNGRGGPRREEEPESSRAYGNYAELHCHTAYSFDDGASHPLEMLQRARELGLHALAITDHDNLCGAMEFAQAARSVGIRPIIGVEITLNTGAHLTLLAQSVEGYSNISRLVTRAHMDAEDRLNPGLDEALLQEHSEGVICLSGCRESELAKAVDAGDMDRAGEIAARHRDWFGDRYFIELQHNFVPGDHERVRAMARLAREMGIPPVATGNAHYHVPERHRLHEVRQAVSRNESLEEAEAWLRPNDQFHLRSPGKMRAVFRFCPEAVENTVRIADRCEFDLASSKLYHFPQQPAPEGHTASSWLRKLCEEAAVRRYGAVTAKVGERLDREIDLLERHDLCGFILQYHEIIRMAREVQEELGLVEKGRPIEDNPPGRGRGSSVALLVGYLVGLSHIDPLQFDLRLERFMSEEMGGPPDIDLDFPRDIRERLILQVHERWGYEHAALTGMISTYRLKGAVRDAGKALGLPEDDLDRLARRLACPPWREGHHHGLSSELREMPEFGDRADAHVRQELVRLVDELIGMPKYLAQHPGGMVLSAKPLSETVPLQRSAIDGRYIIQWDKDSADDAGFVKIDFLALGALSQMNEALELIRTRHEAPVDLSRIDFEDQEVYGMLHRADTIGVFQVESAAQMQTLPRLRPRNLTEMAWEVGCVRPGVGVNDGVTRIIARHTGKEPDWDYDHPLEEPVLARTYGVPLYQDQLMELAVHVAGMTHAEGDRMRRAFTKRNRPDLVEHWKHRFMEGAERNGVPEDAAERIFAKFNGEYQFPESHAYAFGVTAYQAAWLKRYYPLEFYVALVNQQPMGFWSVETIKEDARRHGFTFLNPDVNRSGALAVIDDESIRLGFRHVAGIQEATSDIVLAARDRHGPFTSLSDFMSRTGVLRDQLDALADAGAFDSLPGGMQSRRERKWEAGLRYRPVGLLSAVAGQHRLDLPVEQDAAALPEQDSWEEMLGEYRTMGVHPAGHIMAGLRGSLPGGILTADRLGSLRDGDRVVVAGVVVRRQRPLAKAVFITLEDETGHVPLILWPGVYDRYRDQAREPIIVATGTLSRRDGTVNVVVDSLKAVDVEAPRFKAKDWG